MNNKKKVNQILTRIIMLSALIWATVLIVYGYRNQVDFKLILISAAFVEFLQLSSSICQIRKTYRSESKVINN